MITLTDKAVAKVKEIAEAEGLVGQGLRVKVVGGGCAGFSHDLYFETEFTDADETYDCAGIKVYVDPTSNMYLEDTEIDYVEEVHGAGFKFNNPNVKSTCGCGSSVNF